MVPKKEVTIYDLAVRLNISPTTVSRGLQDHPAINKATKKKIMDLANEIGYRSNHFARNLRQQKTQTIGVIAPRLNSNFMSTAIAGMENVLSRAGYNMIISQSSESYKKEIAAAKTMFNNRVDGLLVSLAYDSEDIRHFEPFISKHIPLIFFDRVAETDINCTNILIDNRKAAYNATRHLIEEGCRNIVHITALQKRNVYIDRLRGYKDALGDHGIPFREENVIVGSLSQEAGMEAAAVIKALDPVPDAVFAANDNAAIGCMLALKKAGYRIPKDIAFIGFNNDPVCNVIEPNLTTINYPGYELGEIAAQNLINHLNGSTNIKATNTIILRSDLVIRESSLKSKHKEGRLEN